MTTPREEFEKNWNESDFSAESFIDKSAAWGLVQAATAAAEAKGARVREAARRVCGVAMHTEDCSCFEAGREDCDCGLDALRRALAGEGDDD